MDTYIWHKISEELDEYSTQIFRGTSGGYHMYYAVQLLMQKVQELEARMDLPPNP
jgi:hypothetical protein